MQGDEQFDQDYRVEVHRNEQPVYTTYVGARSSVEAVEKAKRELHTHGGPHPLLADLLGNWSSTLDEYE